LEAAAAGKPVVASRATGAVDSVLDGVTGMLVPIGDAQALASAIECLLNNPALAHQMGKLAENGSNANFARSVFGKD